MTQLTEEQIEKIEEAKKEYLDKADELWETLSRSEFFERRQKIWKEYIKKRDEVMNARTAKIRSCDENYNRNANKED